RAEVFDDVNHPNVEAAFEVPGVKSSELYIFVKDEILIIQGQRVPRHRPGPHPSLPPTPTINRSHRPKLSSFRPTALAIEEFNYGKFSRALRLPPGTTAASIRAGLSDGLLTITWPG
ncbi:hypothetical protein B0H10DRAFT_1838368, partial [Mycena sp. CBHHK59/15]